MTRPTPVTLDAGALIAVERRSALMRDVLEELAAAGGRALLPAAVLAQVYRDGSRQVPLARLLNRAELITVVPLDRRAALLAGTLCGQAGTADIADASVVLCATGHGGGVGAIVTSDPGDIRKLLSCAGSEQIRVVTI